MIMSAPARLIPASVSGRHGPRQQPRSAAAFSTKSPLSDKPRGTTNVLDRCTIRYGTDGSHTSGVGPMSSDTRRASRTWPGDYLVRQAVPNEGVELPLAEGQ